MKEKVGEQIREEFETLFTRVDGNAINSLVQENIDNVNGFVRFVNGKIFVFPKRYVITSFVYPYRSIETEVEANKKSYEIFLKERFFEANMESLVKLDEVVENKTWAYSWNPNVLACNLVYIVTQKYLDEHFYNIPDNAYELTLCDKILFKRELEVQKRDFMKKLETFWKRFGVSKLRVKTFYDKGF